jgi:hypothetical protein
MDVAFQTVNWLKYQPFHPEGEKAGLPAHTPLIRRTDLANRQDWHCQTEQPSARSLVIESPSN